MRRNNSFILIVIFLIVLFNSIIYSALNTSMFINGDANIRIEKDIRITDIKVLEQTHGSYETYNSDYSKNTTSMQVSLPSSESIMIYEVTITNKGDIDYEVTNIVEESYSNGSIKYELIDIEDGSIIDRGTTHKFKIKFTTTENNIDNKTTIVLKYIFEEYIPTLYNIVAKQSRGLDTSIDFGVSPTKDSSGVYEMNSTKDDINPVYYYRGIIDNNNANFAGFCWKIVRTTSTGGIKLVYNGVVGVNGSCNNTGSSTQIGTNLFNSSYQQSTSPQTTSLYLGYMYNGIDSSIKKTIDIWYEKNLLSYTNMLEDTIWCNDRSIPALNGTTTHYGSYERLSNLSKKPIITCPNKNDSFTVDEKNGNGLLKYPIALLTADELLLAGTNFIIASTNYLYTNTNWWTMSPGHQYFSGGKYISDIFFYYGNSLSTTQPNGNNGIRPAISLSKNTLIKEGNGTISNPYKLFN